MLCLSKLYRAVDTRIFGGLAQEAVSACTLSIQQASRQVARKAGPLDAQLFMVKHLLFLREQIAPFDVDFAVTDIDLDFSHMREHMRRIMAGDSSLFTLSSNNAVVRMLGTGGPRVLQYQVRSSVAGVRVCVWVRRREAEVKGGVRVGKRAAEVRVGEEREKTLNQKEGLLCVLYILMPDTTPHHTAPSFALGLPPARPLK